ncbi:MAG: hypothetical protein JRG96_14525 [Deltaproteobacteria bacterium]|nr:hypothetical protein [Deltaproteobacteria bacterium]
MSKRSVNPLFGYLGGGAARVIATLLAFAATLLVLAATLLVLAPAASAKDDRPTEMPYEDTGELPTLDPAYRQTSHKVVLITDEGLNPKTVTLDKGQLVAWISYAKAPSAIVFEREVARDMICHSLVNFTIQEDELRSAEIHAGEFASFCQLKPGRYRYNIIRTDHKLAGAGGAAKRLQGEIIVGNE